MEEKKEETISKENIEKTSKKYGLKFRATVVILVLLLVTLIISIIFRMDYLNIKAVGEKFTNIFYENVKNNLCLMGSIFAVTYIIIYVTNLLIKHGLKKFFIDEKKDLPKLPNKTFALIGSIIVSSVGTILLNQSYKTFISTAWFGKTDPIFNVDIAYYIFTIPFIQSLIYFSVIVLLCLIVYIAFYYVIVMNMYLDGVDIDLLKKNTFLKQIISIIATIAILICSYIFINSQNVLTQEMLTIESTKDFSLVGAGKTDVTIKVWGYRIFSVVLLLAAFRLLKYAKKANFKQSMISIAIVPVYLVGMFICMAYYDHFVVKSEVLDNQKQYIAYNIENTKEAYGINIEQKNINTYDTITFEEIVKNDDVIKNIPIITESIATKTIAEQQDDGVYYSFDNTFLTQYNSKLVYLTPREILSNLSMSYNNRTFRYTHGYSGVINSASETDENGHLKYILSDYSDSIIKQPRIYFGLETNSIIVTNTKFGQEYDYPITATTNSENTYNGEAGLCLGLWDRLMLGISNKNLKIVFSKYVNKDTKIISNRNIIERAQTLLPDIIYDDDPYLVIREDGSLFWVLDGYTTSNEYPYSQSTVITVNGDSRKINYIRNSVKVLIDAYNGTTKFYITDRDDPIIMAYRNLYPTLFEDLDEKIPEDISKQFVYPKLLYDVQAKMARIYHEISEDVLYRASDIWEITPDSSNSNLTISGQAIEPYYTMVKLNDTKDAILGLVVTFNKEAKQNIISYMVGTYEDGESKLYLYKFNSENSIAGIMQLNAQIEEDETIAIELSGLEVAGTKINKNTIIVPINNTLLYVEPIYQVRLNESEIPSLKKVIVASGNKLAIGNTLEDAISNLFTDYAVNLEVFDMQDINQVIDALIKSNGNLEESLNSNDFEMIGKDLSEVESLIKRLEELRKIDKEKNEIEKVNEEENLNEFSEQTNTIQNNISTNNIDNSILKY